MEVHEHAARAGPSSAPPRHDVHALDGALSKDALEDGGNLLARHVLLDAGYADTRIVSRLHSDVCVPSAPDLLSIPAFLPAIHRMRSGVHTSACTAGPASIL